MIEPTDAAVLVLDPHEKTRITIVKFLSSRYVCREASSIAEASEKIAADEFAAVVVDHASADHCEFLSTAQFIAPESSLILTTKDDSPKFVVEAFRSGVFDILIKPFELAELENSVIRAVARSQSVRLQGNYFKRLEERVADGETRLEHSLKGLESSYGVTLKALINALEARDAETHGHSERVVTFSLRLGHEMGLDEEQRRDLELGAMLHDIGKIGVPDAILRKPGRLSDREWEKMKQHPVHGHRILRDIEFLEGAARVVLEHHERWDGKGYPRGLRGNEIDITARVFAVADAFDAMTSDRVYSRGKSFSEAFEELKKCAGSQFDPEVIEAFNAVPATDWEILHKRSLKEKKEMQSFQSIVEGLVRTEMYFESVH